MNADMCNILNEARPRLLRQANATLSVNKMMGVSGERINLPLPGRDIEIILYRSASKNAPLLIGYHSGGWLFGGCALNDPMWLSLSEELDVNIASIGYRMAPAYKWRDSLADAYDSVIYLRDNSEHFGFNRDHISLIGPSAGGNMAAAVCIQALRNKEMSFDELILLYPLLDVSTEPALKGPGHYGGPAAYIMNEQHIQPEESRDPLASPVFADIQDLKGFPDTLCFVAGYDALRHEGRRFCEKITAAGGNAICIELPGMSHCYFELGYRDRLTDFEKGFIGPSGVEAFESGAFPAAVRDTIDIIKNNIKGKQL